MTIDFPSLPDPAGRAGFEAKHLYRVQLDLTTADGRTFRVLDRSVRKWTARQVQSSLSRQLAETGCDVALEDEQSRSLAVTRFSHPDGTGGRVAAAVLRVARLPGGGPLPTARGTAGVTVAVEVVPAAALDNK